MAQAQTKQGEARARGPLRRLTAIDAIAVREMFMLAMQTIEPDDQTQRQLFAALMPNMYVLRQKGCSFMQLTTLLNQCGFKLQPSTVRTYYTEMLASKMDLCVAEMNDQLLVLAKVREISRGSEISGIAAKVVAAKEQQRTAAAARVDAVFAHVTKVPTALVLDDGKKNVTAAPEARGKSSPPSAAPEPEDGFGLLSKATTGNATIEVRPGGGFFAMDEGAPQVPVIDDGTKTAAAPATPAPKSTPAADATAILRCTKLQPNIPPLEQRPGVPDAVYEEGLLEHPAIPRLMLTKDERLYGALLELFDTDGVIRTETFDEKRFRIKWKQPIPVADTESMKNFVKMHHESFADRKI